MKYYFAKIILYFVSLSLILFTCIEDSVNIWFDIQNIHRVWFQTNFISENGNNPTRKSETCFVENLKML